MSTVSLDTIFAELTMLRRAVEDLRAEGQPGMTQAAFARKLGISDNTVARMLKAKKIKLQDGLVPYRFLRERLS